jgi:signal transduction histidine kinase
MNVEITRDIELDEKDSARMDLHSFLNVMNILMGELQLIRIDLGQPDCLPESFRMAEDVLAGINRGNLTQDLALELSSISFFFAREASEAMGRCAAHDPSVDESVANVVSILSVATVRLREYIERQRTGLAWAPHPIARLNDNFKKFFAAVEKNSRGRYHIIFNVAEQEATDYLVNLRIEAGPGRDALMMPPVMQDVFRDLIANARKYTPPGGEITAGLLERDGELRMVVEDTGCGIPADELERVVEFGFRGRLTRDKATMGGGFGLTKAYVLTKRFGGRMWLDSEEGRGTRVTIHIPVPD